MRKLLFAAMMLLILAVGPSFTGHATAQQPAPTATQTRFFVPWQPNGMPSAGITVTDRRAFEGNPNLPSDCQAGSITTQRPDAWRCGTADPCFLPFLSTDRTTVACAVNPWSGDVNVLMLSRPLPTPQECSMMMGTCPRPLDLTSPPWAVELANGAKCTAFTGTRTPIAGMIIAYGCDDGGGIAAPDEATIDKTLPLWRAFYVPKDNYTIDQVDVLTVWH